MKRDAPTGTRRRLVVLWLWLVPLMVGLVALAFEAGRRYPFAVFDRPPQRASPPGWQPMAPAPVPRNEAASAVVRGRLYVFGGFLSWPNGEATALVEVFDPPSNRWSRRQDMPSAVNHRQAAVSGDTVWFAGGFVGSSPGPATDEVWGYHTVDDRWFPAPSLPAPRGGGALVAHRGRLHYYGGFGPDRGRARGDHWVLDLTELARGGGQWRPAASLPEPRGQFGAAALGDFLYAIGGSSRHDPVMATTDAVHRYAPDTDTWTVVASLPLPRSHFEAATIPYRGRIIIAGGWNLTTDPRDVADVSVYDPQADAWTTVLRLPSPALGVLAGVVGDTLLAGLGMKDLVGPRDPSLWMHRLTPGWLPGDLMPAAVEEAVGGVIQDQILLVGKGTRHTLAFDLRTGRWLHRERYAHRPSRNYGHAAAVADGKLYLLGGLGRSASLVQVLDPASNRWSYGPDLPFRAAYSATAVIGGDVYVAGGVIGDTVVSAAARLNLRTETWTPLPPMPFSRSHAASGTDGARFYVFGGRGPESEDAGSGTDQVQVYDPLTNTWTVSRGGQGGGDPAPLPRRQWNAGQAVYADGNFWIHGGQVPESRASGRGSVSALVDKYNPSSNEWSSAAAMPLARAGVLSIYHAGHLYVAGGARAEGIGLRQLAIHRLPFEDSVRGRAAGPMPPVR